MDWNEAIRLVKKWGKDHNIYNYNTQLNKCFEELGEIATEINHQRLDSDALVDGFGDTLVSMIILADILGVDLLEALNSAYQEIKDRKGTSVSGNFIKNEKLEQQTDEVLKVFKEKGGTNEANI